MHKNDKQNKRLPCPDIAENKRLLYKGCLLIWMESIWLSTVDYELVETRADELQADEEHNCG